MNAILFLSLKDVTAKYANEIYEAVSRVVDSGWYLQGRENKQFEQHYADILVPSTASAARMDWMR